MKITRAKPSEYEEIQRFLEDAFGHACNYFSERYPQRWSRKNWDRDNILLKKEGGKIAALVRIFPLRLIQNGAPVTAAGIGSVATAFRSIGRGHMSQLLNESFGIMAEEGYPLSVLWGDRHRYGNFGYESAGSSVWINITARSMEKAGVKEKVPSRYEGDKEVLKAMLSAYSEHPYRKERTSAEADAAFKKQGTASYYIKERNRFAYISIQATEAGESPKKVLEYAGDSILILGMLQHISRRFGTSSFLLQYPSTGLIPESMLKTAADWGKTGSCKMKIINLEETLRIFMSQPGIVLPDKTELTFSIEGDKPVVIKKLDGRMKVDSGKGENIISLGQQDMVRLLFGPVFWPPPSVNKKLLPLLHSFLPFNFFIPELDHI